MSTRVCSPPGSINMDLPRDLHPSLPTSSSTQSSSSPQNPMMFGSSSSSSSSGGTEFTLTLRSKNVARSLFGSPDPRSGQYARDKVREIKERDKQRWNFDFDNEKPLEGRYKWVPVNPSTTTASGSSLAEVSKVYSFSSISNVFSQSAPSTLSAINAALNDSQPLLSCFPPTPVKINPKDEETLPDRLLAVANNASSSSSQSSPETSTTVIKHIEHSIPSPPTSLEEGSSSPAEDESTDEKPLVSTAIRSKTSKLSMSQPQQIIHYLKPKKRPAQTKTASPSAEKKAAL